MAARIYGPAPQVESRVRKSPPYKMVRKQGQLSIAAAPPRTMTASRADSKLKKLGIAGSLTMKATAGCWKNSCSRSRNRLIAARPLIPLTLCRIAVFSPAPARRSATPRGAGIEFPMGQIKEVQHVVTTRFHPKARFSQCRAGGRVRRKRRPLNQRDADLSSTRKSTCGRRHPQTARGFPTQGRSFRNHSPSRGWFP